MGGLGVMGIGCVRDKIVSSERSCGGFGGIFRVIVINNCPTLILSKHGLETRKKNIWVYFRGYSGVWVVEVGCFRNYENRVCLEEVGSWKVGYVNWCSLSRQREAVEDWFLGIFRVNMMIWCFRICGWVLCWMGL